MTSPDLRKNVQTFSPLVRRRPIHDVAAVPEELEPVPSSVEPGPVSHSSNISSMFVCYELVIDCNDGKFRNLLDRRLDTHASCSRRWRSRLSRSSKQIVAVMFLRAWISV